MIGARLEALLADVQGMRAQLCNRAGCQPTHKSFPPPRFLDTNTRAAAMIFNVEAMVHRLSQVENVLHSVNIRHRD